MTTREWRLRQEPGLPLRLAAAALLLGSRVLTRVARRLGARKGQGSATLPLYEFHAEAGAPEGALYVDGQLVGHLPGVSRL